MAGACEYSLDEEDDDVFRVEPGDKDTKHTGGNGPLVRLNTIDRYGFIRATGLPDPNTYVTDVILHLTTLYNRLLVAR